MVIRIPNWLGDALMATPVYSNLCKKEKIYLFGPSAIVNLFKSFPNTEILYYEKGNIKKNIETLKPFKNEVGLLLTNSFSSAWLFFRAGLRQRWGYARDFRSFLLTRAVKTSRKKLHQRDYYLHLLKALGLPTEFKELFLPLEEETINRAKILLKELKDKAFIVLAPGAAYGPAKMWPKEYYKKIAHSLTKKGIAIVVTGSSKEKEVGEFIKEGNKSIYNLCGKTDLTEVAGIFSFAKAVISNDSGLMHLAAALKIPQIAIFGSTDPEKTGPLNPKAIVLKKDLPCSPCFKRTCKYGHYKCLKDITPEEVLENIHKILTT
ncbi:MAG: ADP-heptose:LPS heptosyltransferase [Thermodesulfobacterium sp.]|uniref:lipopolysaccharide heptosyltransferase II n=1 Tax=Candidatus Thermodesulfobacterium syntrophicum TaxID=3060442 RepID=A0AAE3P555_9BACT|nr:ADP-heptose:LPS heptosyltransferase [Candidatus Thermodesulfobacterium syntrophicum]